MTRKIFLWAFSFLLAASPVLADSQGSATGGTAGTQSTASGCIDQAPTLTSGQQAALRCGTDGSLIVSGTTTAAPQIGSTFAPSQVSLNSSTATQILSSLASPSGRNVCNLDASINIYIGPSNVTSSTGIKLLPGSCWDASHTSAAIYGISASATPTAAGVQY